MARRSAIQHPNPGNDGGPLLQSGKLASSESSASEKAEDTGERQNEFVRYSKSSEGQPRAIDDAVLDYDSSYDHSCTSGFEFQKGDRALVRQSAAPYLNKVAPSKWDDAEKWLVSPTSGDAPVKAKTKSGPLHGHYGHGSFHTGKRSNAPNQYECHGHPHGMKSGHQPSYALDLRNDNSMAIDIESHQEGTKSVTVEHNCQNLHQAEGWSKEMGPSTGLGTGPSFAFVPPLSSLPRASSREGYPLGDAPVDMKEVNVHEEDRNGALPKPLSRTRKPASDSLMSAPYTSPAPAVRSISMRDMGTEMTPIASQEPSRTGTPIRATTPTFRSPVSSCASSPRQGSPIASPADVSGNLSAVSNDGKAPELSAKAMQGETRREVQIPGLHIGGKLSIVPWASKEEEDADASKSLKIIDLEEVKKNVLETRAAAWEEAEQSKYMARFKREEAKILAWESHQKAKAEAELRRVEVKLEKMRMHAHEKLLNKLAAAREKAEDRRAAADVKRCEQATKTSHQADYIRHTGRLPPPFLNCNFCL